jgi:L-asparagine oxygenase
VTVFDGPRDRPHLRVDFAETRGVDPAAQAALDELSAVATRERLVVHLEEGDLLVVDNRRAVHGRTRFKPRHDNMDRWLLRAFLTRDLMRSESVRPGDGRIVEPDYARPIIITKGSSTKERETAWSRGY